MEKFGPGASIKAGLCGAALVMASFACGSGTTSKANGGTGGASATGGSNGTGGASGTGGTNGTGGASGTGGTNGTGGTSATGGSTMTGDAAGPALSYTFDSSIEGFSINTYHDTTSTNLGDAMADDAGADASPAPALTWDMTDGSPTTPSAGCLKLVATFTGYNQYVDVKLGMAGGVNLKALQLGVQVQLASSTGGAFPGGAILEADTGTSYTYGGSQGITLQEGTWLPLSLDLDGVTTAGYDDTMVVQVGVQFYSGSPPATAGTTFDPIEATFLIDTFQTQ
jgi:hypothetical protein